MGITSKEIAKICGVSRATVDRALNGKDRISPKTKEKILAVAKQMGYRKDLLARGLVKGKTMCISVLVFDIRNHYFSQLVNTIELESRKNDYFLYITLHEKNKEKEYQLINSLVGRRVDGILVCPVNKGPEFEKFLLDLPIPVVSIGNFISPKIPYVGIDDELGAKDATSLLISKGYEFIIFVCPPLSDKKNENVYTHEHRAIGFQEQLNKNKQVGGVIIDSWDYINMVDRILESSNKRTAILCSGDIYALQILKHLKMRGVKVPQDVGIMGFDNIDMLEFVTPKLTTLSNEIDTVARTSVDMLIKLMNSEPTDTHVLIAHKIIDGDSI